MNNDETKEFLDSLPELEEGKTYKFKCYPGISCFNACCSDLNMVLTPYDILRMRHALGKGSIDFIRVYTDLHTAPDTNFPVFTFRMTDNKARTCAFVTDQGCAIYEDRPGACRMYPLGRATRPDGKGFEEQDEWTGVSWKEDQGFHEYTASNDRYMSILARVKEGGRPVSDKMAHMATLAMYKVDEFQRFIVKMRLFERLDVDEKRQKAILEDEFVCLSFAMDWFELMLFHDTSKLQPKGVPTRGPACKS